MANGTPQRLAIWIFDACNCHLDPYTISFIDLPPQGCTRHSALGHCFIACLGLIKISLDREHDALRQPSAVSVCCKWSRLQHVGKQVHAKLIMHTSANWQLPRPARQTQAKHNQYTTRVKPVNVTRNSIRPSKYLTPNTSEKRAEENWSPSRSRRRPFGRHSRSNGSHGHWLHGVCTARQNGRQNGDNRAEGAL